MSTPAQTPALPDVPSPAPVSGSPVVGVVHRIEGSAAVDRVSSVLARVARPVMGRPATRRALQGAGTGHALHPALTDLPIGMWTATVFLDLFGGPSGRPAARRLLAAGIVSALPTALTGLAEWQDTGLPERRVGSAHAVLNSSALGLFALSYAARARGRHGVGVVTALAGGSVASAAAYLGGHLTTARKVGSRDAAYGRDGVGPVLSRP